MSITYKVYTGLIKENTTLITLELKYIVCHRKTLEYSIPSISKEVEGYCYLKKLIYVIAYVIISQGWIQNFKICTVDILKY